MPYDPPLPLPGTELKLTAASIAAVQEPSGAIPWFAGDHTDPWDHLECAMALELGGQSDAADAAWGWTVGNQRPDGSWPMRQENGVVTDATADSNQCAYIAVAAWHRWLLTGDRTFVASIWPVVKRALDFVVGLQAPGGQMWWARAADGHPHETALLTGCSSTLQSLRCGLALASLVGEEQPDWEVSVGRLWHALRTHPEVFAPRERWSMDWYYPVLGGVLRGGAARARLRDHWSTFVVDGLGIRCVSDEPWVTGAETCELVMALNVVGLSTAARRLFADVQHLRCADGSYWTGWQFLAQVNWPEEQTTWTAAAVILAADALAGGVTDRVFRGDDLPAGLEIVGVPEPRAPGCACVTAG
ncbi:MAG: hypothetical protein ACQSGP_23265 [Frankia sp.]